LAHTLTFTIRHQYGQTSTSITVPAELKVGDRRVRIPDTKVDTGASFCIFNKGYGESLGLNVEAGRPEQIGTATGQFRAYGHEVVLSALGLEFHVLVYFADVQRNVLGRRGWLEQVRIGIVDHDGELFVSAYDDEH
jgi:predicted aspartyl protease